MNRRLYFLYNRSFWIKLVLGAITTIAFGGAIYIFSNSTSLKLESNILRITYQFLLIVIVGGLISFLFRDYTLRKERREADAKQIQELKLDLISAYNDQKEIKRLLRARAWRKIDTKEVLLSKEYDELMIKLNEVQLRFEFFKKKVSKQNLFIKKVDRLFDETDGLWNNLNRIESYLNKIVEEYETAFRESGAEMPQHLFLSDLPMVYNFIKPRSDGEEKKEVTIKSFHKVIRRISKAANRIDPYN